LAISRSFSTHPKLMMAADVAIRRQAHIVELKPFYTV
jgi:hypothetical protein